MAEKPYKPSKKELERWAYIESLPISVRYPIRRKDCVQRCLRVRALIRHPEMIAAGCSIEDARFLLKKQQMSLLKLRIWRSTGHYPPDN